MTIIGRLAVISLALLVLAGVTGCGETKAEEEATARTATQEEQQQHTREAREEHEHKAQLAAEERAAKSAPAPSSESPSSESDSESSGTGESSGGSEQAEVGSSSHATDAQFCSEHECIGSFTTEGGTVVECSDGTYSHAGGISGACSHHGGEKE